MNQRETSITLARSEEIRESTCTKFAMHHFHDIDRLAVVGERKWQEGMATFCKPFTNATIRYFDHADTSDARRWLGEV